MKAEKRLIDANAIKYQERRECGGHGLYFHYTTVTKEEVDKMPTVDAVEVVRCKDCRYFEYHKCGNSTNGWFSHKMSDDFCSCGERRTENGC